MTSPCFHVSQGHACDSPSCNKDHIDLSITVWKNGDGETTEAFCLNLWTPGQISDLRDFIQQQNIVLENSGPAFPFSDESEANESEREAFGR